MSVQSPVINRWVGLGLKQGEDWGYFDAGKELSGTVVPAGQRIHLDALDRHFVCDEGTIIDGAIGFDHPNTGIAWETYDLISSVSIKGGEISGLNRPEPFLYISAYGLASMFNGIPLRQYNVTLVKELGWQKWLRIYAFNDDVVDHIMWFIGFFGAKLYKPVKLQR